MGTKIILSIVTLLLSLSINAQRKWIEEAKGVALCECYKHLALQYDSVNALAKSDYSIGYFIQMSELPVSITIKIQEYTRKYCTDFWAVPQDPSGNMIGYSCWQFYKSAQLEQFIRKIIREGKKEKYMGIKKGC